MRASVAALVVAASGACAAHGSPSLADRFVTRGESAMRLDLASEPSAPADEAVDVRRLMEAAQPPPRIDWSVEARDRDLALALAALERGRGTAEAHHQVADEYLRLGVLDLAHEHYADAARLDASDARAHEELARIWRDWGLAPLGLGDAYRAVYHAPASAEAQNLLGTLLQTVGAREGARRAYERAIILDPGAAYAWNNLCYLDLLDDRPEAAVLACREALTLAPDLAVPKQNLARAERAARGTEGLDARD